MKIWLISQNIMNDYDTYDSAVVFANDEMEAVSIHPNGNNDWDGTWVNSSDVKVELIGTAKSGSKKGVICASFNAG